MSGYRYGSFHEGPDPLAGPPDAAGALDDLAERVLRGDSVRDALRDLLRDGTGDHRGLADLAARARERRRALEASGNLDGLLDDLRRLLDEAITTERGALFPDPSDDARFREALLDNVPDDLGSAVRALASYDWRSPRAREAFEQLRERLARDVVDQQFRNLSHGIDAMGSPEAREALRAMLTDLNDLLDRHRRGEATQADYEEFVARHRDLLPEAPATLEEFIDDLARRSAALERMLASLDDAQRAEIADAMAQAMADLGLQAEMSELADHLGALRPEFGRRRPASMRGDTSLDLPSATDALAELADLESLSRALDDPSDLDAVDEAAVERALGRSARDDLEALRAVERALRDQGYLELDGATLRLTPKAIRTIGRSALRAVFADLDADARGTHAVRRSGAAGELTGTSRPWEFGDELSLDVVRTVRNAATRRLIAGEDRMRLTPGDFEVQETETATRAAVALLVDQSFSMVMNDTWSAAKTMAFALHALTTTMYPLDALQIIAFADLARVVPPHELANLDASVVQGTNLHHALMLAGRFLDRHVGSQRIAMVVTDGEPTAHLLDDGTAAFAWPPSHETVSQTVAQVDRMTRRGVPISWFRLGDDPGLARFLDAMARRNRGRVIAASAGRLGDYVVTDYVRTRATVTTRAGARTRPDYSSRP